MKVVLEKFQDKHAYCWNHHWTIAVGFHSHTSEEVV
jgi:hypothetical protein